MTLICGIDEAGRGPVIGPMVICGVVVNEADECLLRNLGVKDSKLLSPNQREFLFDRIKKIVKGCEAIIISPHEIDSAVNSKLSNLNWLEADKTAEIINKLKPDIAYIDSPTNNTNAYKRYLAKKINTKTEIIAEHKADVKYAAVSAASIIAKVTRDREIGKLKKKYKIEFGSGYPSDPLTMEFLKNNYNNYPFFRKSWAPWKNALKKTKQRILSGF